jgi:hypothetical protein
MGLKTLGILVADSLGLRPGWYRGALLALKDSFANRAEEQSCEPSSLIGAGRILLCRRNFDVLRVGLLPLAME